jgi:hypothetical protein
MRESTSGAQKDTRYFLKDTEIIGRAECWKSHIDDRKYDNQMGSEGWQILSLGQQRWRELPSSSQGV